MPGKLARPGDAPLVRERFVATAALRSHWQRQTLAAQRPLLSRRLPDAASRHLATECTGTEHH